MLSKRAIKGLLFDIGSKYRLLPLIAILLVLYSPFLSASNVHQSDVADSTITLSNNLKFALENSSLPLIDEVTRLYESKNYSLIWSDGTQYNNKAHDLYKVIKNSRKLGLDPGDYDLEIIQYFLESTVNDPKILSKSDVTFTHAYVKLASHIDKAKYSGSTNLSNNYGLLTNELFITDMLGNEDSEIDIPENDGTENLPAKSNHYSRLFEALNKYRSLNDDFEPIQLSKKSLTIGDSSDEIIKARNRLYELGDYKNTDLLNTEFDEVLALAITDFQYRHGLKPDGILGKRTVREINKSFAYRATQLELNLERAKQLSELQDSRYILVNVPEYKLYVIENGETIYQTRVIVGKKKNRTPSLSSEISEFVLNPYWNVPASITRNEIIPKLQADPEYLTKNNMKVISRINKQNFFLNPNEIDWNNIKADETPFRIRQDPGRINALGRIKFIFPNNYKVYLHDTPTRRLFARNTRAFSHGCVRVENPLEFAEVLISSSESVTTDDLYYFANRKKTKVIKLDQPIPIHITYMTAWVNEQGIINFRPDIYKRDSHIARALYNASP